MIIELRRDQQAAETGKLRESFQSEVKRLSSTTSFTPVYLLILSCREGLSLLVRH